MSAVICEKTSQIDSRTIEDLLKELTNGKLDLCPKQVSGEVLEEYLQSLCENSMLARDPRFACVSCRGRHGEYFEVRGPDDTVIAAAPTEEAAWAKADEYMLTDEGYELVKSYADDELSFEDEDREELENY